MFFCWRGWCKFCVLFLIIQILWGLFVLFVSIRPCISATSHSPSKCSSKKKKYKFRLFSAVSNRLPSNNSRKSHSFLRLYFCFVWKIIHEKEVDACRPVMLKIKLAHSYIPTRFCLFHSTVFPIQIVFNIEWFKLKFCYRAVWIESKVIRLFFIRK